MNEGLKTLIYVVVAAVACAVTYFTQSSQPDEQRDFVDVGEPFYPSFDDPLAATALRLITFDSETADEKRFEVVQKDGLWSIPSHHNYPADGEEQLAKTASSMIGIKRGALAGRRESDFERLGVIDPLERDRGSAAGVGQRITLSAGDEVLADYIIGKSVTEEDDDGLGGGPNRYYVRRPDETKTYVAELAIELSTDFTDWIEQDLLEVSSGDINQIMINRYSFDPARQTLTGEPSQTVLNKDADSGDWTLADMDPENEELNKSVVTQMVNNLSSLSIVGVRPKPEGLSEDLKSGDQISLDIESQLSLRSKGYYLLEAAGGVAMIPQEGEVNVGTKNGIMYSLQFGKLFIGDEYAIEAGFTKDGEEIPDPKDDDENSEDKEGEDADAEENVDEDAETEEEDSDLQKSRYLFIRVSFDPKLLGPNPQEPKREDFVIAKETSTEESAEETDTAAQEASEERSEAEKPEAEQPDAAPEESSEPKYDEEKFQRAMRAYEKRKLEYEQKIADAVVESKNLRARFADWYYVITADQFDNLRLKRENFVGDRKEETPADATSEMPAIPFRPADQTDAAESDEAAQPEMKAEESTAQPEGETAKKEELKQEEPNPKTSDDAKSEETADKDEAKPAEPEKPEGEQPKPDAEDAKAETSKSEQPEPDKVTEESEKSAESSEDSSAESTESPGDTTDSSDPAETNGEE